MPGAVIHKVWVHGVGARWDSSTLHGLGIGIYADVDPAAAAVLLWGYVDDEVWSYPPG